MKNAKQLNQIATKASFVKEIYKGMLKAAKDGEFNYKEEFIQTPFFENDLSYFISFFEKKGFNANFTIEEDSSINVKISW